MLDGHTQNISEARGDGMCCFLFDIIGVVPIKRREKNNGGGDVVCFDFSVG